MEFPAAGGSGEKFDPLHLDLLSRNLREALRDQPRVAFPPREPFLGAGLYALYYVGDLPLYRGLRDTDVPLYVGKAEAGNSSYGDPSEDNKPKLYQRIAEKHAGSVAEVESHGGNIGLADFQVRYLRLDDVWIVLGERALLRSYTPVLWNSLMPGFGANPPGTARRNARSIWDTIHPGRPRAGDVCNRRFTREEMERRIADGIAVSLMPDGLRRQVALQRVRAFAPGMIWSPARTGESDRRLRVFRVAAFLAENAAIGSSITEDDWVDCAGQEDDMLPDPEDELEQNIASAEAAEHGEAI
jgi:Eco29kI restriction endonuclease